MIKFFINGFTYTVFSIFTTFVFLCNISYGGDDLKFDFDFARFFADDSTLFTEFYYQYDKRTFVHDNNDIIRVGLKLELYDKADKRTLVKQYQITDKWDSNAVSSSSVGLFKIYVPFGKYSLKFTAVDLLDTTKQSVIEDSLYARNFDVHKPFLSDIELAYKIEKSNNTESPFYKSTYEVVPNPELVFTYLRPTVYFYYEIYGIDKTVSDSLIVLTELISGDGISLYSRKNIISKRNNALARVGQIAMNDYPSDGYLIRISIADTDGKYAFSTLKKFYFINPRIKKKATINPAAIADAKFGGLSASECDKLFREVQYLATKKEKNLYENLKTKEEKQRFLSDFWKRRDRTPDTPRNEYMEEYFKRLKYVNERFRTKTKEGYLTDRGRVYLLYGEPDEIDRYPYTLNSKPYELWYYHSIEGGVVFVFGDLTGIGDYVLLHSTKRGELYDSNWRERIRAF